MTTSSGRTAPPGLELRPSEVEGLQGFAEDGSGLFGVIPNAKDVRSIAGFDWKSPTEAELRLSLCFVDGDYGRKRFYYKGPCVERASGQLGRHSR
jgi:hypothetical protein